MKMSLFQTKIVQLLVTSASKTCIASQLSNLMVRLRFYYVYLVICVCLQTCPERILMVWNKCSCTKSLEFSMARHTWSKGGSAGASGIQENPYFFLASYSQRGLGENFSYSHKTRTIPGLSSNKSWTLTSLSKPLRNVYYECRGDVFDEYTQQFNVFADFTQRFSHKIDSDQTVESSE